MRFSIEDVTASRDGRRATVRTTVEGAHEGPFLGREPTGRRLRFGTIDVHEAEGGFIRRSWHIEDFQAALLQMGLVESGSGGAA